MGTCLSIKNSNGAADKHEKPTKKTFLLLMNGYKALRTNTHPSNKKEAEDEKRKEPLAKRRKNGNVHIKYIKRKINRREQPKEATIQKAKCRSV